MNGKHLKGLAVIGIADGTKLGTVDRAYLDPAAKRVVGFSIVGGPVGGASEGGLTVAAAAVHALGPDAMTLDDAAAAHAAWVDASYGPLVVLDDLAKRKVVTEGGTDLGEVVAVEFDEQTFAVTSVEVSPGFFKGNKRLPGDQVLRIGQDVVVVADVVAATEDVTIDAANAPA